MVFPMSKDSKPSSAVPKPPSFDGILSDLQSALPDDVAFKTPEEICKNLKRLTKKAERNDGNIKSVTQKQFVHTTGNTSSIENGTEITYKTKQEDYTHVTDFLQHCDSLVTATIKLKECGENMDKHLSTLEEKIKRAEESWKEPKIT